MSLLLSFILIFSMVNATPVQHVAGGVDHSAFSQLLSKHVSETGVVDYAAFKKDRKELDQYLKLLKENPVQTKWSRNEQMAYWINAYNAFTIKLILENYPVESIMDINGGKAWDKKWIKLGNQTYSLNQIENDILRPQFNDPRIHFAVNCAAKSCPPLMNKAWTADNLEKDLEARTKAFINNRAYNVYNDSGIKVSKIFEWYAKDFGQLNHFINKYSVVQLTDYANIEFQKYDWKLNGK